MIKPELLMQKNVTDETKIEFIILKLTNRIAKMGKDPKWVFETFD